MDAEIFRLDVEKINALQASDDLREQSLTEVNHYFDNMNDKIIEFIETHLARLEAHKQEFVKQRNEISAKYERLEELVSQSTTQLAMDGSDSSTQLSMDGSDSSTQLSMDGSDSSTQLSMDGSDSSTQLAMEGSSILTEFDAFGAACTSEKFEITEVEIKVLQGRAWDASTTAMLQLKERTRPRQPTYTPLRLSTLGDKKYTQRKQVTLAIYPKVVRLMGDELWSCENDGNIEIFNHELEKVRSLVDADWRDVYDVIRMSDGKLVIAGYGGLFHATGNGKTLSKIDDGSYTSVVLHDSKLYAYANEPPRLLVYQHHTTWNKLNTLTLPFEHYAYVTLSVSHNAITACSDMDHKIIVTSHTGEVRRTFGEHGSGAAGLLYWPRLCQSDEDGSLLIADITNHRLQVVDKRGQWRVVGMKPGVNGPCCAVYSRNKLYVASSGGALYKLSMYTSG